jgi:hypothetical protein
MNSPKADANCAHIWSSRVHFVRYLRSASAGVVFTVVIIEFLSSRDETLP